MLGFCKQPVIVSETVEMLFRFINGMGFESLRGDFIRKHGSRHGEGWKQSVGRKTNVLSGIMSDVCAELDAKDQMLQYYFAGYSCASVSGKCCLAQIITWLPGAYDADFDRNISNLKELWRKKLETGDRIMLAPGLSLQYEQNVPRQAALSKQIDALQYPEEFSWRLFKLVSNPEYYIDELKELIRPIAKRLSKALTGLSAETDAFEKYWKEFFERHTLSNFAMRFCNVDTEFPSEQNVTIYINFMNPTTVISEMNADGARDWSVHIGWLIDEGVALDSDNLAVDEICEVLKVLSDKSKFAILQSINDTPRYGAELADKLGLTNATISRHMNTLYNCGFITAEKDNTRVFYRANKEHIEGFLNSVRETLLMDRDDADMDGTRVE